MAILAKHETAEMADILTLAQQTIELAEGDLTKGNLIFGSPLVYAIAIASTREGILRYCRLEA